jgi:hypothetical protein
MSTGEIQPLNRRPPHRKNTMNIISATLGALRTALVNAPSTDERYLADARDVGDLERRMRELDDRHRLDASGNLYPLWIYPAGSGR